MARPRIAGPVPAVTANVVDITLFQSTLLEVGEGEGDQSTGRIIHAPNGWVFSHSIRNDTQSFQFIWTELAVTVTFESDWVAAKEILLGIASAKLPCRANRPQSRSRRHHED